MAVLKSDDEARSLRYRYMGPPDYKLWAWEFPQWFVWLGCIALGWLGLIFLFRPPILLGLVLAFTAVPLLSGLIAGRRITGRALRTETGLDYAVRTVVVVASAPRPRVAKKSTTALTPQLFPKGYART